MLPELPVLFEPAARVTEGVADEPHGRTLALRMQDETNVLVLLERPVTVRLGDRKGEVEAVRLWVDDLEGFMTAVRTHIP